MIQNSKMRRDTGPFIIFEHPKDSSNKNGRVLTIAPDPEKQMLCEDGNYEAQETL